MWTFDLKDAGLPGDWKESRPGRLRIPLSAAAGKVFVRLGRQTPRRGNDEDGGSYIFCLNIKLSREKSANHGALSLAGSAVFEGALAGAADRLYVAETRLAGLRMQTTLACYDADSGRHRWSKEVCDWQEADAGEAARPRQQLLTMTAGQLVYCSHTGAVVAVDPWSGRRLWGLRYPGRTLTGESARFDMGNIRFERRSLAPCLFAQDRLYVAPQDSDTLFCLDPGSGSILWERAGIDVVHLLGAAGPRLLFTTTQGLRAVNAASGADDA